jgi:hypothetical protein
LVTAQEDLRELLLLPEDESGSHKRDKEKKSRGTNERGKGSHSCAAGKKIIRFGEAQIVLKE